MSSLNVAVSAAIALYALSKDLGRKKRRAKGLAQRDVDVLIHARTILMRSDRSFEAPGLWGGEGCLSRIPMACGLPGTRGPCSIAGPQPEGSRTRWPFCRRIIWTWAPMTAPWSVTAGAKERRCPDAAGRQATECSWSMGKEHARRGTSASSSITPMPRWSRGSGMPDRSCYRSFRNVGDVTRGHEDPLQREACSRHQGRRHGCPALVGRRSSQPAGDRNGVLAAGPIGICPSLYRLDARLTPVRTPSWAVWCPRAMFCCRGRLEATSDAECALSACRLFSRICGLPWKPSARSSIRRSP